MNKIIQHIRTFVIRGLLAIIPLALSILAIRFIYLVIDKRVGALFDHYVGFRIPGVGIALVVLVLYLLGLIASNVIGRKLFGILEGVFHRIPIVKTAYQVGKQVSDTLALPEKQVFKKAVLVDFLKTGQKVVGFTTGTLRDERTGENLLKVFIPTVPNPTSGYFLIVKESEAVDTGWTIDEAMRTAISGGIIGPEAIRFHA